MQEQNNTSNLQLATLRSRAFAFVIDDLIVIVLHIIIDSLFYNLSLVLIVNRGIPQTTYESMSGMGWNFSDCSRGIPFKI